MLSCKNLKVFSDPFPATSRPGERWWTSGVLGVLQCHRASIFAARMSARLRVRCICSLVRLGGLLVPVHHVLSCVPRWLVSKLCSSLLPGHKHVDIHAVKPGHALRSVLSQFVPFLVKRNILSVLRTLRMFSGHLTSCASYTHHQGPGVVGILILCIFFRLCSKKNEERCHTVVLTLSGCSCSFETARWRWRCRLFISFAFQRQCLSFGGKTCLKPTTGRSMNVGSSCLLLKQQLKTSTTRAPREWEVGKLLIGQAGGQIICNIAGTESDSRLVQKVRPL